MGTEHPLTPLFSECKRNGWRCLNLVLHDYVIMVQYASKIAFEPIATGICADPGGLCDRI